MTRLEPPDGHVAVLLHSDDDDFRRALCDQLVAKGVQVVGATGGSLAGERPDVVVVDTATVELASFEPIQRCSSTHRRPRWLYLATGDSAAERVALLEAGADDVMSRPLDLDELCLRVMKLSSRPCVPRPARLVVGDLALDDEARRVTLSGRPVRLSPTEFGVLRLLLRNAGTVMSKQQILREVWGFDDDSGGHLVELYMSYLRKKLGPRGPELIRTVRGSGYVVRPERAS